MENYKIGIVILLIILLGILIYIGQSLFESYDNIELTLDDYIEAVEHCAKCVYGLDIDIKKDERFYDNLKGMPLDVAKRVMLDYVENKWIPSSNLNNIPKSCN